MEFLLLYLVVELMRALCYWEQPTLSDAFSVEPDNSLNKRYLYHWLLSIQNKIYELKQGSGIPHGLW